MNPPLEPFRAVLVCATCSKRLLTGRPSMADPAIVAYFLGTTPAAPVAMSRHFDECPGASLSVTFEPAPDAIPRPLKI